MRLRLRLSLAGLIALSLAVTGCTASVSGSGVRIGGPADGASPTPAPTSRGPGGNGGPPQTRQPPGPAALDCAGAIVSPPGAPYCYTAPGGLDPVELGDPTAGEEGSFRTSFGFGPADHIDVQAYSVGIDTDELTDQEIVSQLAAVVADLESGGFTFGHEPRRITVDGARAFAYVGHSVEGGQTITAHFAFRGETEVQVNCSSTQHADLIATACADVLASMQIAG